MCCVEKVWPRSLHPSFVCRPLRAMQAGRGGPIKIALHLYIMKTGIIHFKPFSFSMCQLWINNLAAMCAALLNPNCMCTLLSSISDNCPIPLLLTIPCCRAADKKTLKLVVRNAQVMISFLACLLHWDEPQQIQQQASSKQRPHLIFSASKLLGTRPDGINVSVAQGSLLPSKSQ